MFIWHSTSVQHFGNPKGQYDPAELGKQCRPLYAFYEVSLHPLSLAFARTALACRLDADARIRCVPSAPLPPCPASCIRQGAPSRNPSGRRSELSSSWRRQCAWHASATDLCCLPRAWIVANSLQWHKQHLLSCCP